MTLRVIRKFPTLYSFSRTGKTKVWEIEVLDIEGNVYLNTSHGYENGVMTPSLSSPILGKNIGKKNETSPEAQALSEAASKFQKQKDRNYKESVPTSTADFDNIRPMLAHSFEKRGHDIVFPAYVQPKLNGVRCLAVPEGDGTFKFMSRGSKEYNVLGHINDALYYVEHNEEITVPLDGEIFHPEIEFEDISSGVKKRKDHTVKLQYWIYDVAHTGLSFKDRITWLEEYGNSLPKDSPLIIVPTFEVNSLEEILEYHAQFSLDYEGTMIRNAEGVYVFDYRSPNLQKLKDFMDEEFEIIGGKEATGPDAGTVVFRCKTKDNKEFDVRPVGSRDLRAEYLRRLPELIGQFLTVKFQNYSQDGIPIFPVGLIIRELYGNDYL